MFHMEFMKKICSKVKEMENPEMSKVMAGKLSLADKLLGSGESRVMFR